MGAKRKATKAKKQAVPANPQVKVVQQEKLKQEKEPQETKAPPKKIQKAQPKVESDQQKKTIVSLNKEKTIPQTSSGKIQLNKQENISNAKINLPKKDETSSIKIVKLVAPQAEQVVLSSWIPEQNKSGTVINLNQDSNSIARNLLNVADQKTLFPAQNEQSKAEKSILDYSAKDRKLLRLARFNCQNPTAVNTDAAQEIKKTNEDKIKKRQERFGTQLSTNEKKVDRMMRFGIPVKEEEDKKKEARMKKFGLMRSDQDQIKRMQRIERFNALQKVQQQVRPESELARKREVAL